MLMIVVRVDAPLGQAIGIKEAIAMYLEHFGDSQVLQVEEIAPRQFSLLEK